MSYCLLYIKSYCSKLVILLCSKTQQKWFVPWFMFNGDISLQAITNRSKHITHLRINKLCLNLHVSSISCFSVVSFWPRNAGIIDIGCLLVVCREKIQLFSGFSAFLCPKFKMSKLIKAYLNAMWHYFYHSLPGWISLVHFMFLHTSKHF